MNYKFLIFNFLWTNISGSYIDFAIDYFNFKNVPAVIIFSCNKTAPEYVSHLKNFNKIGIAIAFSEIDSGINNNITRTNHQKLGILFDLRCHRIGTEPLIFNDTSKSKMFDQLHYWLVLGYDIESVLNIFNNQIFDLFTDFVVALYQNETDSYMLYDMFYAPGQKLFNVTFLGSWDRKNNLNINLNQSKFERRSNMNGLLLKALFFKSTYKSKNESLEEYLDDYSNPTQEGNSKFGFHILSHFAETYNFTLKINESSAWLPGDENGPIVRAVGNCEADITGTPLAITPSRSDRLKYVHQDWPFRTCFIFRNPQITSIKIQEIMRPFDTKVWYLIGYSIIIILVILTVALTYEEFNTGIIKYLNSFLITFGILCQQGTDIKIKQIPTRIVLFNILIFGLLMYNYYSASIVSARLAEPIFKINDSLVEMGKLHLKMTSEKISYFEFLLRQPNWDAIIFFRDYWLKIPESNRYMDPDIGMEHVRKGDFAYHTHPDIAYSFIERMFSNREICELMEVHIVRPTRTAFAMSRNTTIAEVARVGLTKISEVGLKHRQVLRWSFRKPRCSKNILSVSSVTLSEFAPILLILFIGALFSIVIYVIEVIMASVDIDSKFHCKIFKNTFSNEIK